jgi:hypothetical protein
MRTTRLWIPACCCVAATALLLMAQPTQRAGLYETTSNMTWQQSPMPNGMQMPGGGPHTTQACVTQEMIDKYGAPPPQQSRGNCQMTNVNKTATGMTGDWICTGAMNGKGSVESTWTGDGKVTAKVHFTGVMQMGPQSRPIEWTMESTSVYKGADCGDVKPMQMPAK